MSSSSGSSRSGEAGRASHPRPSRPGEAPIARRGPRAPARSVGIAASLAGAAIGALLLAGWLWRIPLGIGWYHDDGAYVATASAMAEGRGPRLEYLAGAPFATRYPLLWPSLLAIVLRLARASHGDLTGPLVLLPIALAFPLALLAWGRILRRGWRLGATITLLLLAALALNPLCLEFCRFPMSEIPFLALSLWAVALADDPAPASRWREAAAACLAVAAVHTRLAGAALVAAMLCAFAVRRRGFAFVFTLLLTGASLGAWVFFLHEARAANGALAASPLLAYDLGYGGYAAGGPGRILQAALELPRTAFFATHIALGATLPMRMLARAQAGGSSLPLAAAVLGLVALLALGARARLRTRSALDAIARVETWYVPLTLGVVLIWPAATWRLLLPIAPWILSLPVLGIGRPAPTRGVPELAAIVLVALAIAGLPWNVPPAPGIFLAGGLAVDAGSLERAMVAVRRLPGDAVVGSPMAPLVWLRTQRRGVGSWVEQRVEGISLRGRSLRTFFIGGGEDPESDLRGVREAIAEYPGLGVGYALSRKFPPPDLFGAAVADVPGTRLLFGERDYDLYALPRPETRAEGEPR